MRNSSNGDSLGSTGLSDATGEDFLFLFDLLAHSCGLEATLRVLTHSDATFYEICKPSIDLTHDLELEEDKVKVKFGPAHIERWLQVKNLNYYNSSFKSDSDSNCFDQLFKNLDFPTFV